MRNALLVVFLGPFTTALASNNVCAQTLNEILEKVAEDSKRFVSEHPILVRFPLSDDLSAEEFFPSGAVDSELASEWYADHLTAMDEPSLYAGECIGQSCVRFTWLRSFHVPISIRVEFGAEQPAMLHFKQTDGAGGYRPGELTISASVELGIEAADEVKSKLEAIMRNTEYERVGNFLGHDGAQWIIEYRTNDEYVIADQWSPESGDIFNFGLKLLELSSEFEGVRRLPIY